MKTPPPKRKTAHAAKARPAGATQTTRPVATAFQPTQESKAQSPALKTVLLAVSGMSPAIITETVWALAHPEDDQPPVVPEEVVVITTARGQADLQRDLLTPRHDWQRRTVWDCLREAVLAHVGSDKGGPKLQLGAPRVIELPDPLRGVKCPALDLRSAADNDAAADFILEEVRRLAENPDVSIIASIAGGRKTMGALVYAAMSLLAHETDSVTHVLVSEPFENCRGFFYPDQPAQQLTIGKEPDHRTLRAANARIHLAKVPFVPLRNLFERELAAQPGTFALLVERCSRRLSDLARRDVRLEVLADRPEVRVNDTRVPLSVAEYVLLRHLAEAAFAGRPAIDGYDAAAGAVEKTAQRVYEQHDQNDFSDWRYKALPSGKGFEEINQRWITKNLSSLREKLCVAGPRAALLGPLLPERGRFSLDLPSASIILH